MIESEAKSTLSLAIASLIVGLGCGPGGAAGRGRIEACLPSCIADVLSLCPVPAGACTTESISGNGTSSCYAGGIQVVGYTNNGAGSAVDTAYGLCYIVFPTYVVVNNAPRLQSIQYDDGGIVKVYGCITMDATDPNNRKGTVRCGVNCSSATGSSDPGQPFDFDNPACSFFRVEPGAAIPVTDGVAYDDPNQMCSQGATGSCPVP